MQKQQDLLIRKIQLKSFGNQVKQQGNLVKCIKGAYGVIKCQNKLYLIKQIQTPYLQQSVKQHFEIFNQIINIHNNKHISKLYRHIYDNRSSHYLFQQYNSKLINLYEYQQKNNQKDKNKKKILNSQKEKDKNKEATTLKLQQAKDILQQIIYGLSQIHYVGLIHQNLNFYNIILSSERKKASKHEYNQNIWKLTNFGVKKNISKYMTNEQWNKQKQQFLSPQIYELESKYFYQVDIWALGVLFYYMLSGKFPFNIPFNKSKQQKRMRLIKQAQQLNRQKLDQIRLSLQKLMKDFVLNKSCENKIDRLYELFMNIFKINKYQRLNFLDLYRNKYSILSGILYEDSQKGIDFYQSVQNKIYQQINNDKQQFNKKQSSIPQRSNNEQFINQPFISQSNNQQSIIKKNNIKICQSIYVSSQNQIKQ